MKSGTLYGWGSANFGTLPVTGSAVDGKQDCIYPSPIVLPKGRGGTRFVSVSADMGRVFCAVDDTHGLWVWGGERSFVPSTPTPVMQGVMDACVNAKCCVAVGEGGRVFLVGPTTATPVAVEGIPEAAVSVAACGGSFLAVCGDGAVWASGEKLNNGLGEDTVAPKRMTIPPVSYAALGSRSGAAITLEGNMWVWGDGLSGTLGLGARVVCPCPVECPQFREMGLRVTSVACTRGQHDPKRMGTKGGQEGPRTHVVTEDGVLWIAGTTHKGLGGDHLYKTMTPESDHLVFYKVGGKAADASSSVVLTGAAEDLRDGTAIVARRMGMASTSDFGRGGDTHYLEAVRVMHSQPCHIHSLALSDDGRLFTWGCGSDGRLGLRAYMRGPGGSKRTLKCYVSTPSVVEAFEDRNVVFATAGRYWSFAIVA